jgi:hypothetical protein
MDLSWNRLQKERNRERKKEWMFVNINLFALIYKFLKYSVDNHPLNILETYKKEFLISKFSKQKITFRALKFNFHPYLF